MIKESKNNATRDYSFHDNTFFFRCWIKREKVILNKQNFSHREFRFTLD